MMDAVGNGKIRVVVIDMQPITPAVGGGRQRLLGLYHALGPNIDCTYVGSYDWPGETSRDQQLTPGLREIVVPLSDAHHRAAKALSGKVGGRTVIDIAFADQVALSPEFLRVAREHIHGADVVVFSHPWCFPPLADALRKDQLVVYDSQNVEAVLRASLFSGVSGSEALQRRVAEFESSLCRRADLVLACSDEDVALFEQVFEVDPFKLRIVPNGTFTGRFREVGQAGRIALRKKLGLPAWQSIAIFLGSHYGPNADAARFIAQSMAPCCPVVQFIVAGGVGDVLANVPPSNNLRVMGRVDDALRDELLQAADVALNPMATGSGTNIKMFDYMAAGLPILTTEIGARGICTRGSAPEGVFVESLADFCERCTYLATTVLVCPAYRRHVRALAQRMYSWKHISNEVGTLLFGACKRRRARTKPATRVAMMTTWNVTCGIGEHASYLVDAMAHGGADVLLMGNFLTGHRALGLERDLQFAVSRTWTWDNTTWRSGIDQQRFCMLLRLARPDVLVIQHHTAYAPFHDIEMAVNAARDIGIRVLIEMHNARDVSAEHKQRLCELGAQIVVHHPDGAAGLQPTCMAHTRVISLPVRQATSRSAHSVARSSGRITIGGFGFLRPYKGLPVLIKTLAALRPKYPSIRYVGMHAFYPGDSSEQHLVQCRQLAEDCGVSDAIEIATDFLPIDEVVRRLSDADIIVMPYQPSNEGASAAVNIALAARRPVVVSSAAIFRPVEDAVFVVTRDDPGAYTDALESILSDPCLAEELTERASAWAEQHSYANAAALMLDPSYFRLQNRPQKGE